MLAAKTKSAILAMALFTAILGTGAELFAQRTVDQEKNDESKKEARGPLRRSAAAGGNRSIGNGAPLRAR